MRIAVFSDVHGNLTALEAVLADIRMQAPDMLLCAGDLAFAGPRVNECVSAVRESCHAVVYGNTEDWTLGRQAAPDALKERAEWTLAELSAEHRGWLSSLPFSHHIPAPDSAESADALLLVHANPREVNTQLFAGVERQQELFGQVRQADTEVLPILTDTAEGTILFGHQHIPALRTVGRWHLVNVSSVHMPADGDPRAKWALLDWRGGRWHAEHHYVPWNAAAEAAAYELSSMPGAQSAAEQLRSTGMIPQRV